MFKNSLLMKLFLPYLWIIVVAVVAIGWYASHGVQQFYLDQTARDLEARATLCSMEMAEELAEGRADAVDALCKRWGQAIDTRITVILPSGEVIGDTDEDPQVMDNHRQRPEIAEAFRGAVGRSVRYSTTLREDRMYVAVPSPSAETPTAVVRTSIPATAVDATLAGIKEQIIVTGLLVTGLIGCVSLWLTLRVGRLPPSSSLFEEPLADATGARRAEKTTSV